MNQSQVQSKEESKTDIPRAAVTAYTSFYVALTWKQDLVCVPLRSFKLANGKLKGFPLLYVML